MSSLSLADLNKLLAGEGGKHLVERDQVDDPVVPGHLPYPPRDETDGVEIGIARVVAIGAILREFPPARRGRLTIDEVKDSTTYTTEINGSPASTTSGSPASESDILRDHARDLNALAEPVRFVPDDPDGDGDYEHIDAEGLWSKIEISSVSDNTDYTIQTQVEDDDPVNHTINSGSGATENSVLSDLHQKLVNDGAPLKLELEDTTGNGDYDQLQMQPDAGTDPVSISESGNLSRIAVHSTGDWTKTVVTSDHTFLADATQVDFVLWGYNSSLGWSPVRGGTFGNVDENLTEMIKTHLYTRIAIQFTSVDGRVGAEFVAAQG